MLINWPKDNGVKYLLVRPYLFDRRVDAKGMKIKDSKETVRAFYTRITRKSRPRKIRVDKGEEFAGELKTFCNTEAKQLYFTISEAKVAVAEPRIR